MDDFGCGVFGGEDDDVNFRVVFFDVLADGFTIDIGKVEVEND